MIDPGSSAFWRATLALCLGSFLVFANVYITQPLMPLFRELFQLSSLQATFSLSLTTLSLGLSLLVYGPLSDALGRRRIMIVTLMAAVLVTGLISLVESYAALLWLRILQGFFLGGLPAIAIAYMGDEFSRKALLLAVGFYISGNSLGGIAGRLFGGILTDLSSWQLAFAALSLISVVGVLLFAWLLPPSRHFEPKPLRPRTMAQDLLGHLANPLLLAAYLIGGLNFFIFANQYSFVTYVLAEAPYNLPPTWLGMLFLTYLSGTLGSAVSGRVAQQLPQAQCMLIGILIMMLGSLTTLGDSLSAIIGGLLINSFGFFFCHSMASSWVNRNAHKARASASSLYLVFYYLGASSGGFYLNLFWTRWHWPGVIGGSLLILSITAAAAIWLLRQERALSAQPV
ncbi:MFS transporter [Motiliproteus sediminis]|uniref:MFS transporter n=1 Tax=Motiliproteus sediminis TaxID=1468178 RepID=UPI001AF022EF|nr:MFS transporter [Motiliproteus sediminis]